ncbi:MAG: PilZ domain-containing protein [Burkholderiaceae bacterium]|nr:MAG: PilZ domain-containing protein [Burkholderiaceae bacterium]
MRTFIRHPAEIPIEVQSPAQSDHALAADGHDVSLGGLALSSQRAVEPGEIVDVSIPFVQPPFASRARVAWCNHCGGAFELGVEFLDYDDAFRARMVEQICYIERYKKDVAKLEGRMLSTEEAASEWIHKHAAAFSEEGEG